MSNQNVIFPASSDGQNTFASSVTRPSFKSAWRFHHQSTSSLKLWTSRPPSNSSSSWRNIAQKPSCKRALVLSQRLKLRLLERRKLQRRSHLPWEPVATPSPSWLNKRRLNLSSSLTMLIQSRWVFELWIENGRWSDEKNFFTWRAL